MAIGHADRVPPATDGLTSHKLETTNVQPADLVKFSDNRSHVDIRNHAVLLIDMC